MLKRLVSHTAVYGLAPQIPKIVSIFVLPVITPYLTKVDFGIYGVVTAAIAAVTVFGNLGLNVILSNTFIKSPNHYKWAWRQIYGFLILWNIPYSIIIGLLIYIVLPIEASDNLWWIVLINVTPVVLFGPTSLIGMFYYQLSQRPLQIAIRSAFIGVLTIILNLIFIVYFDAGYMGWFLSSAIGQLLLQMTYWIPLRFKMKITPIFNFKKRFIVEKLKVSLPTVPHYYAGYLLNVSDRLVMKFFGIEIGHIGMYNAANIVSNPFLILGTASGQAVGPLLLESYKKRDEFLARRLIFSLQILFLIGTTLVSIWSKEIFFLLIKNKELQTVYPISIILIMAYSYRPMYLGANNRLFYIEKTKALLMVTFVAGVGNLCLNLIFIPIFGFEAAAYTTFVCLMYMGYIGYFMKEFKSHCSLNYYPLGWLLLTIALTATASFVVEFSLIVKGVISAIMLVSFLGALFYRKALWIGKQ